jgi:hypothetical protein
MFGNFAQGAPNWLGGMMGGGSGGPYQGAENDINDYTRRGVGYLNPYWQMGNNVGPQLNNMFGQFSNPMSAYQHFSQNYQMSPGAQAQLHTGLNAVSNQMAQMGLGQSGPQQEALARYTQGLINQDMNSQWQNMLGGAEMGSRIGGMLYGTGADAASRMSGMYGQAGEDIAGLQEAQAQAQAAQEAQDKSDLWGAAGDVIGFAGGRGWL